MLAAQVEPKNETSKKCEKQRNHSLTRKAPYKPYAEKPHVRICAAGARQLASLPLMGWMAPLRHLSARMPLVIAR